MNKRIKIITLFTVFAFATLNSSAQEPFMGEIKIFAGTFAPRGWAFCDGQTLAISENQALYSLLGITYGGDGRTTFALPDLRGRVVIGPRRQPGSTINYMVGQQGGVEKNILSIDELPTHTHQASVALNANKADGTTNDPTGNYPAATVYDKARGNMSPTLAYNTATNAEMNPNAVSITIDNTGGNEAINNVQPFLSMNYIICVNGIYPARQR